jgi:hypothetical protein
MKKYSNLPSSTQISLFILYGTILVVLLLNLIGIVNFYHHPKTEFISNPVYYTLDWQNQPGTPFTITNMSTYQFFDIHLVVISTSNFTQNSNITLYAYGTTSQSFMNNSLANLLISYDGTIPYPPSEGYSAGPSLE